MGNGEIFTDLCFVHNKNGRLVSRRKAQRQQTVFLLEVLAFAAAEQPAECPCTMYIEIERQNVAPPI